MREQLQTFVGDFNDFNDVPPMLTRTDSDPFFDNVDKTSPTDLSRVSFVARRDTEVYMLPRKQKKLLYTPDYDSLPDEPHTPTIIVRKARD